MTDGVFLDRSFKQVPTWAIVWKDSLLPIRFGTEGEARAHLYGLKHGTVVPAPALPADVPVGRSLNGETGTARIQVDASSRMETQTHG